VILSFNAHIDADGNIEFLELEKAVGLGACRGDRIQRARARSARHFHRAASK
jgi:hypothetical protein